MQNEEEIKVTEQSFAAEGITALEICAENGTVTLAAGKPGDPIEVKAMTDAGPGGDVTVLRDKGTMKIIAKAKGFIFNRTAQGVIVSAPATLKTAIKAGTGDINILNMDGELDIKTGTGDVNLAGGTGKVSLQSGAGDISGTTSATDLDIKTGCGDIDLAGLTGSATIKSGSGDIELAWAKEPEQGACTILAGNGDISLHFPKNAKVDATIKTGHGDIHNSLPRTQGGFPVQLRSGSGDVSLSDDAAPKVA